MMKKIAVLAIALFLIALLPVSFAYIFGTDEVKVIVFDSYGTYAVKSNGINLTYAIDDLGYFKSNVINLSVPLSITYASRATTTVPGGSTGPVSGGGGTRNIADISFSPSEIFVDILQESFYRDLIIKNIGNVQLKNIDFKLSLPSFVRLENFNVSSLNPGEEKTIKLSFSRPSGILPGLYTGLISVEQQQFKKTISLLINVVKLNPFITLDIEKPLNFTRLNPGENLDIQLVLKNLAGERPASAEIIYSLLSLDNKELVTKSETILIDDTKQIDASLAIPADTRPGSYILYTKVNYKGNIEDFGSALIEVAEPPLPPQPTRQEKILGGISAYATKALSTSKKILKNPVYLVVIAIAFILLIQIIFKKIKKEFK